MTSQISIDELQDDELRQQFNHLMEAMNDIVIVNPEREEGAYEALNQRIHQAVTEKPILACITTEAGGAFLLSAACCFLNFDTSHDVIKCLIHVYPSALLGLQAVNGNDFYCRAPILTMAGHPGHCVLLPWIATDYTWILDHERCPPVVFELLEMYGQRQRTSHTVTTINSLRSRRRPGM